MKDNKQGRSLSDKVNAVAFAAIVLIGCVHLARYIALGLLLGIVTVLIVETLLVLIGYMAWKGRLNTIVSSARAWHKNHPNGYEE